MCSDRKRRERGQENSARSCRRDRCQAGRRPRDPAHPWAGRPRVYDAVLDELVAREGRRPSGELRVFSLGVNAKEEDGNPLPTRSLAPLRRLPEATPPTSAREIASSSRVFSRSAATSRTVSRRASGSSSSPPRACSAPRTASRPP